MLSPKVKARATINLFLIIFFIKNVQAISTLIQRTSQVSDKIINSIQLLIYQPYYSVGKWNRAKWYVNVMHVICFRISKLTAKFPSYFQSAKLAAAVMGFICEIAETAFWLLLLAFTADAEMQTYIWFAAVSKYFNR